MNIDERYQLAIDFYQAGHLQQAEHISRELLKIQPFNSEALHLLGVIYYQLDNNDFALKYIKESLSLNPSNAEAYYNLGNIFKDRKQLDDAMTCYQKALQIDPTIPHIYINLGYVLHEKKLFDEAAANYQKALEIDPSNAVIYYNLGLIFHDKGQLDEAIIYYQKAINHDYRFADVYYNLGCAHKAKKEFDEAIRFYQKAIQLNPSMAEAYHDLGFAWQEKGQIDKAIPFFQKALEVNPGFAEAYYNLALYHHERNQIDTAIGLYQKAIAYNPDFVDAHFNLACAFLILGNYNNGWIEYEWRLKLKNHCHHNIYHPAWNRGNIAGKTILLHAEQGFGDTIQFIRYAPLIAHLNAKVIVECPTELKSLLQGVKGIEHVIACGEPIPTYDTHCPLASLPLHFQTRVDTIPTQVPYIFVSPCTKAKWRLKIEQNNAGFKIGIVWSGRMRTVRERHRSCSHNVFLPIVKCEGVIIYSLQKDRNEELSRDRLKDLGIIDFTDDIYDFSDTAALIENLDLVISIDTAIVHLAGALGKSVWTLLPFASDWRWLLNRDDSAWYPTMRLFRQPSPGDWESVIAKVKDELLKLLHEA